MDIPLSNSKIELKAINDKIKKDGKIRGAQQENTDNKIIAKSYQEDYIKYLE